MQPCFYERQTHTLFAIPVVPLRPESGYAVLITKRLKDLKSVVGSPLSSFTIAHKASLLTHPHFLGLSLSLV